MGNGGGGASRPRRTRYLGAGFRDRCSDRLPMTILFQGLRGAPTFSMGGGGGGGGGASRPRRTRFLGAGFRDRCSDRLPMTTLFQGLRGAPKFSGGGGGGAGVQLFPGVFQILISIEIHNPIDFPGGGPDPLSPSGIAHVLSVTSEALVNCLV